MVVKLVWDSKENWWESDVYQTWKNWETAQKVYTSSFVWGKKDLEFYLKLQKKLSEKNPYIIKLKKSLKISKEVEVKEIHFSILPLNTALFEWYKMKSKEKIFISEQEFVDKIWFKDFLKIYWNSFSWIHYLYSIPIMINEFLSSFYKIDMITPSYISSLNSEQINFHNIKVEDYNKEEWILSLIVTDIAQKIPLLIENNRERVSEILGAKSISSESPFPKTPNPNYT